MNNPAYLTESEAAIKTLSSLQPGETYIYFVGFLDEERLKNSSSPQCTVADAAYRLSAAGKIHLTQKRLTPPTSRGNIDWSLGCGTGFTYLATGAKLKRKIGL